MSTTATTPPRQMQAGDTLSWRVTLADYPASQGWALAYRLVPMSGATPITFSATSSGNDHVISIAAATSAAWAAGAYTLIGTVTKAAERYSVYQASHTVLPNLAVSTGYDARSHARKMLTAIEAALEGQATTEQLSLIEISVYSRGQKHDKGLLIKARNQYAIEVRREEAAAGIRPNAGRIYVRF